MKFRLCCLGLLLSLAGGGEVWGQTPVGWTRTLGTSANDNGTGVAVDGSGNAYVTGYTEGNLDGQGNAGTIDIFLVKYNSSGTKL